ncbi:hypothetical protein DD238_001900 [Peronospora effusa]|uniref:TRP C-terminal domain-containing protein n=1 Tax=Peronospora effusa TaxID=542832 RepID=A0A3M6VVM7_9STRA|nr:hypothetical protein DD238_001900 [Peronospora effusa]
MRIYAAAASVAVALGVATAQTSPTTSTSPTVPTSTVSTSSGSNNPITIEKEPVSCVFRYSMPTATNLPSGVATPLITSTTLPDSDSDDKKELITDSVENGSEDDLGKDVSELDTSSSSNDKNGKENVSKTPTSTTKTPSSTSEAPSSTPETPPSTSETKSSTSETKSSTPEVKSSTPEVKSSTPEVKSSTPETKTSTPETKTSTTETPASTTKAPASTTETKTSTTETPKAPASSTTETPASTPKAPASSPETQKSTTKTSTSSKTEESTSTLDELVSTTTAKATSPTGSDDNRRLMGETTATTAEGMSDTSDSAEPIASPTTTTPPSTTTTPPSTNTTPPSTTTTPPSTTTTPPSTNTTPPSTNTTPPSTNTTPPSTTTTPSSTNTTPSSTNTTPSSTNTTPSSTNTTPSSTNTTPSSTDTTSSSTDTTPSSPTKTPSEIPNATSSKSTAIPDMQKQMELPLMPGIGDGTGSREKPESTSIEFSCDETFYSAWHTMGLTCKGTELDIVAAVASAECLIYSGLSSGTEIFDLATCMSSCRFPACNNGIWDYSSNEGMNSSIYANLDFITLMSYAGPQAAEAAADSVQQPFSNLTFAVTTKCDYTSDNSFSDCQCAGGMSTTPSSGAAGASETSNLQYTVPFNKGLEDSHHWPDGTKKTTVDKAGIASTTIASGAATVSIVAGGVMSVASGIVGGTSVGVASSMSAAASVGITLAAVDICQFSIMLTQMNVDARPRFMENMGRRMAPATFTFLPFGKSKPTPSDDLNPAGSTATSRRLVDDSSANGSSSHGSGPGTATSGIQGMEKYAALIGVDPDMLFYLAVAGIACMVGIVFGLYVMAMGVCYFIVKDFTTFSRKWLDKAIGVLMMILILSEYVVGATAMYQICYCIDHDSVDVSFFLAIAALLGLAFGTILYGVIVIKNNEDELRDLGTKDHFDKKFHNRYGPLYDEHSFEGRFFFAPKLLLALLCGMTTGMVWIQGLWQIIVLIALHIVFLLYLEIKQPYPTAFVQKTSSFVIIIKISALFLSFFLLSSATSFTESIPDDLREGVSFAIVGLQVLVLLCLMIRQVYIFYRTWKLKRDGTSTDNKTVTMQTTSARAGSEGFFALGGEPQYCSNKGRGNSLAVLGDTTPKMQDHYAQQTPSNVNHNYDNQPHGSQPQQMNTYNMQQNHFVAQQNNHQRNNEVDL